MKILLRFLLLITVLLFISACTSYGVVVNSSQSEEADAQGSYSIASHIKHNTQLNNDIELSLVFSGGGTRAAAFSYGVLQALRDSEVSINGHSQRMLDEVDVISSVSGGSFTAAYFGLHGEGIFNDFEQVFLRHDFQNAP